MKERGGLLSSGSRSTHVFAPWRRREASLKYDSLPRRFPLSLSSFFRDFEAPGANGRGEAEVLRSSLLNRGGHLGEGKYSPSLWEIPSIWMPGVYGGFTLLDITKKAWQLCKKNRLESVATVFTSWPPCVATVRRYRSPSEAYYSTLLHYTKTNYGLFSSSR